MREYKYMIIDMHVHSNGSYDSLITLKNIEKYCFAKNIDAVFITDHNTLSKALRIRESCKIKVFVGEEINTEQGEIIGLFLEKEIPPNLSLRETIFKIKEQNGVVYVPHPFDRLRHKVIKYPELMKNIDDIDVIETFNARTVFREDNQKSYKFANTYHKLIGAGSDSHTKYELGNVKIEIDDFESRNDFLVNIKNARINTIYSPIFVHGITKIVKVYNNGHRV